MKIGKKLGHEFDAVCDAECNRCDYVRNASAHKDSDNNGICDRCNDNVEKSDDSDSGQQADTDIENANSIDLKKIIIPISIVGVAVIAVLGVIVLTAVAITVIIAYRKKKKQQ